MRLVVIVSALLALTTPAFAAGFASPSGNIRCYLDIYSADPIDKVPMVCLIFDAGWEYPPMHDEGFAECDLDRTRMVILPPVGTAYGQTACHGDVFWPAPLGAISYGSEWSWMGFTCKMATDGVRCTNGAGGAMALNRSRYLLD